MFSCFLTNFQTPALSRLNELFKSEDCDGVRALFGSLATAAVVGRLFASVEEVMEEMGAGLKDIVVFCVLFTDLVVTFFDRTGEKLVTVSRFFVRSNPLFTVPCLDR